MRAEQGGDGADGHAGAERADCECQGQGWIHRQECQRSVPAEVDMLRGASSRGESTRANRELKDE